MEIKVNTTNTENGCINVDEKAIVSLIKELVGTQATQDVSSVINAFRNMMNEAERRSEFWRNVDAKENFRNSVEQAVNACTNCVNLSDITQTSAPVPPVPPTVPPVATPTAQATTEAKVEEPVTAKKDEDIAAKIDELITEVKDGKNMEEVIKRAKEEAENEMSTRMIYFELGRMAKGDLIEMAQRWMDTRDITKIERDVAIRSTKYCMECREAFDTEAQALNQLKAIKNNKFDKFLGILRDVAWICE